MASPTTTNLEKIIKEEHFFEITDLGSFLKNLLNFAVVAASLVSLAFLLWGAVDYLMSEGDQEKVKKAKGKITSSLIGLGLVACVWLIWRLSLYFLGIGTLTGGETILHLSSPLPEP